MINQQEIGKRLAALRKHKGYSQEELAKVIGIPRTALAQIELGNRGVTTEELLMFSNSLEFSIDKFLTKDFEINSEIGLVEVAKKKSKVEERVSVPKLKVDKFKQVLLYILEKCAGKPNVGETVLYKLLYFAEFNYYEVYEEHLIGATFRKLPYGPVPQKLDTVLKQMEENGEIQMIKTEYYELLQKRYIPLKKPDLTMLMASEKDIIDNVVNQLSDFSAKAISDYSHKDMPWKATKDGAVIDYELAFYRETPFSARVYDETDESEV
jgi:transcriptional regulator with XRE-family HTH domain